MRGAAKGLEIVGGARIVDRVAAALRSVTADIVLAANHPEATTWLPGVPVVRDSREGAGGLAGIEAALTRAEVGGVARDALVVAWDMPFVPARLLRLLLDAARNGDADVVLPASVSPHGVEPFCAFYAARTLSPLRRFLDAGGRAAHEFVTLLPRALVLPSSEIAPLGDARRLLLSVNTAEDLSRARAMAEGRE